eukprot:7237825-Alexandrium_andersonii.AAC.1
MARRLLTVSVAGSGQSHQRESGHGGGTSSGSFQSRGAHICKARPLSWVHPLERLAQEVNQFPLAEVAPALPAGGLRGILGRVAAPQGSAAALRRVVLGEALGKL